MASSQVLEEVETSVEAVERVEPAVQLVDFRARTRTCTQCGVPQSFEQFGANDKHPTGYFRTCRGCRSANR
ncbi:MAG: hypothetical protein QOH93_638, partial [Chloroflexia bacterium]|nr:hypothetical protein [Chloroflexia bacterium]